MRSKNRPTLRRCSGRMPQLLLQIRGRFVFNVHAQRVLMGSRSKNERFVRVLYLTKWIETRVVFRLFFEIDVCLAISMKWFRRELSIYLPELHRLYSKYNIHTNFEPESTKIHWKFTDFRSLWNQWIFPVVLLTNSVNSHWISNSYWFKLGVCTIHVF